jgi:hypothetical protein
VIGGFILRKQIRLAQKCCRKHCLG